MTVIMRNVSKKIWIPVSAALLLAFAVKAVFSANEQEKFFYPVREFSNMCAYAGTVYCGVNGVYGETIVQESSIFTIQDGKIYYVEKVRDAYESVTDELLSIKRSDMDGSHEEILAEDVFLAGTGHEKLIGDKLFYGFSYDDDYRMKYACVDINTGERKEVKSGRIGNILGYDGIYLYYSGYHKETEKNILGRISLKSGRDEIIAFYSDVDEEGYIESVSFYDGKFYCLTLAEKADSFDYRTYEYRMRIRDGEKGGTERELPVIFTGSANYSFLIEEGIVFASIDGKIVMLPADASAEAMVITNMKEEEYWGILHFIPGDGYLYYEAISQTDEATGNNDYFYRVPLKGGEAELLNAWFIF